MRHLIPGLLAGFCLLLLNRRALAAEAQLAAAEGKYREGVGIFVEILDAQEAAARARTNGVRALYDWQTALLALDRALGSLRNNARVGANL